MKSEILNFKDTDIPLEVIKKASAQANAGAFISEEAILNWVASWGNEEELPLPQIEQ